LGRRPYNDIVIDNLAVSGEHAVLQMTGGEVLLEDLNSTNGTYVNGKAAKKQQLHHGDNVEVGKYKIRFVNEADDGFEKTMAVKAATGGSTASSSSGFPVSSSAELGVAGSGAFAAGWVVGSAAGASAGFAGALLGSHPYSWPQGEPR